MTHERRAMLDRLRERRDAFNADYVRRGGLLVEWKCPHCQSTEYHPIPKDTGSARDKSGTIAWDSVITCCACGEESFVAFKSNATVEVTPIGCVPCSQRKHQR